MTIHQQIKERLSTVSVDETLKEMRYYGLETGRETLRKFLDSEDIYQWLKGGNFDMKYGSEAFVKKLTEVLGISRDGIDEEIRRSREHLDKIAAMRDPYIFIDTHFKRKGEPIFVLAMMEGRRHIRIDKEQIIDMSLEEVLEYVKKVLRKHYEYGDKLPLWGKIYSYVYHHIDGSQYLFDTQGNIKKGAGEISESKAVLKIGNRDITNLIGGK